MPAPIVGAAVAAGASLASTGGQIYAAGKMNKKTREWNEKMYASQRADALSDWERQNQYNSPAQQMARLRQAGLNPNLVYDNGATHSADAVRSTDSKSWDPQTPDLSGIGEAARNGIAAYQDFTLQDETVKNMRAQRSNMEIDAALKTAELASRNLTNRQNLELYDTSIQTARERLRAISTGTDIATQDAARRAALQAPTLEAAIQNAINARNQNKLFPQKQEQLREQIGLMKRSGTLRDLEINLKEKGVSYNDPLILRMLGQIIDGDDIPQAIKGTIQEIRTSGAGEWIKSSFGKEGRSSWGEFKDSFKKSWNIK